MDKAVEDDSKVNLAIVTNIDIKPVKLQQKYQLLPNIVNVAVHGYVGSLTKKMLVWWYMWRKLSWLHLFSAMMKTVSKKSKIFDK